MKTSNLTGLSEGSGIFEPYFIINMKNTMEKIKYIFNKYMLSFVYLYDVLWSVKLPPKCRKCYGRDSRSRRFPGGMLQTRLDVSCAFVARFVPPPPPVFQPGAATAAFCMSKDKRFEFEKLSEGAPRLLTWGNVCRCIFTSHNKCCKGLTWMKGT